MPSKNLGRVSIVPKGTWNANTVYNRLDAVVHNGSSWLAKKQNTGQMPAEGSDAWQLLAERGADGRQGIDGAPGKGLTIIGHFDTVESLEASVTMPEPGDAYSIGDAEPYDIYTYDGVSQSWLNNGPIKGDTGPQGPKGDTGEPGPQGPKGDTGEPGPQGPKGDTGEPGPQGEPGRGLNISGTVEDALSLPVSAENGDVWNVGTIPPYDLYLYNNGIWTNMGPLQGPEGPQGPAGPAGADGVDGADGDPGPAGPKGDTGDVGPQGPKGDQGDIGPQGPKGEKGESPYDLAVKEGFGGTEAAFNWSLAHIAGHAAQHKAGGTDPLEVETDSIQAGAVTRSKLAEDALYSPFRGIDSSGILTISNSDIGKTIRTLSSATDFTINVIRNESIPTGAEIAIFRQYANTINIVFGSDTRVAIPGETAYKTAPTLTIGPFTMIALKKIASDSSNDYWLVTGNAEVVS